MLLQFASLRVPPLAGGALRAKRLARSGLVPPSMAPTLPREEERAKRLWLARTPRIGIPPPVLPEGRGGERAGESALAASVRGFRADADAGAGRLRGSPGPRSPSLRPSPVERRDIQVFVEAAGVVEPLRTVELKSKASGEILSINAENGDQVNRSTLLVRIDKRIPANNLAQAEAALKAAESRRSIAQSQMERAETLVRDNTITDSEYEETALALSEAEAQLVRARVEVENARIALGDTDVLAPIDGTISSATWSRARSFPRRRRMWAAARCCSKWPICAACWCAPGWTKPISAKSAPACRRR